MVVLVYLMAEMCEVELLIEEQWLPSLFYICCSYPLAISALLLGFLIHSFIFQKFCHVYVALEMLSSDLCLYILDRKCFFGV